MTTNKDDSQPLTLIDSGKEHTIEPTFIPLLSTALVYLQQHLTDEVEDVEQTDNPCQPPWHVGFAHVQTNKDVRD